MHDYTQAVLKFPKLNTQAQQREAVVQGRSLSPYRLRYTIAEIYSANKIKCQTKMLLTIRHLTGFHNRVLNFSMI
ncbi:MAG: hypothetical protein LBJ00_18845 [Planctomycetaceae bacterium]|nr:hypothetical protein [Planctomycetaceae bacterium]